MNVPPRPGMRPPALPPRSRSPPRTVVQAASVSVLKVLPPGADVRGTLQVQSTPTAEAKTKRPLRIFSGTYNARGRPERQVNP